MEEHIKLINFKVGKKDTSILLGNVEDIKCVKKLKRYKILITGNHNVSCSNYTDIFDFLKKILYNIYIR